MLRIAFANEKGGVAKTTSTLSLGAALAENGKKVLIVDMDTQSNLGLALGYEAGTVSKSIADLFLGTAGFPDVIIQTHHENLDLLPSNNKMNSAERFISIRRNYPIILRDLFTKKALDYEFILFDCPPHLGAVTMNGLIASHLLVIPTQPEFFSIYALRNIMSLVKKVREEYNPQLTYRLLLTMYDQRNRTHKVLLSQLIQTFTTGVFSTIIDTDTKLRESQIVGVPITVHAPKSRAAEKYRQFAQEIIHYGKEANFSPV